MNIMVMAGTKDARQIIQDLCSLKGEFSIIATTVTDYGAQLALEAGADEVIKEALSQKQIEKLINKQNIQILVDATHPYAVEATINAIRASETSRIIYVRYERPEISLPENELLYIVESFQEATNLAGNLTKGNILHLAGVNTLHYLTKIIEKERIFVRIVPSVDSIQKCRELGINTSNIIAMQGTFSSEFNRILMQEYDISLVLTKESGVTGGFTSKLTAALQLNIPIIVVKRPLVLETEEKNVFNDFEDLFSFMKEFIN